MKICIDIQSAIAQRAGVGRYTKLLVQNLGKTAGDDELYLAYFDFTRHAMPFSVENAVKRPIRLCPGRLAQLSWKTINWPPYNIFAGNADLFHFPNFIIPPLGKGKSVVTIHDMSFIRFPAFAEEENQHYLADKINDTVTRADAIITDSHFSAGEIQSILDVEPERIFPIHLGIDQSFSAPDPAVIASTLYELNVDRPYILTVGTVEPRKNIPFLIEVFENLQSFDGNLVIAGMPGWKYEPIMQRIKSSSRAASIKYVKYVSDAMLPALYAGAELFATTSFYEGFGFPPLEAMACGTPVISSAGGSLAEVLGSSAIIINDFDIDIWVGQINRVLNDAELRKDLSTRGTAQITKYTWAETARKTWEVYRKIAS